MNSARPARFCPPPGRWLLFAAALAQVGCATWQEAEDRPLPDIPKVVLFNGWQLSPAGRAVPLPGDLPLRIVPVDGGRKVLVLEGGYHNHGLTAVDLVAGKVVAQASLLNVWAGLAVTDDGTTAYVAGGGPPRNKVFQGAGGDGIVPTRAEPVDPGRAARDAMAMPILQLQLGARASQPQFRRAFAIPGLDEKERYTAGIALGRDGSLFVVNIMTDTLYKLRPDGSLAASLKLGYRPCAIAESPDRRTMAVANWGGSSVSLVDERTLRESARVPVGTHPADLAYRRDGLLYVAAAGAGSVSVIEKGEVLETIRTALDPRAGSGATPDALAVSPDGSRLYVANAEDNNVEVVDITDKLQPRILGFIPTGWYPSSLAISPDGRRLLVGIAKGMGSRANYPAQLAVSTAPVSPFWATGLAPDLPGLTYDFVGNVLSGELEVIDVPGPRHLASYTRQARANFPPAGGVSVSAAEKADALEAFRHLKHVIYVLRENRTYDQVLGDLPGADGDPALTLFGERTTPNVHALARRTVTLDRLFTNAEVSQSGHSWSDAAYVTAFVEKTWPTFYAGRAEARGDDRVNRPPKDFLWDACARHGLTYFDYGEEQAFHNMLAMRVNPLAGHTSIAWRKLGGAIGKFGKPRDTDRIRVFIADLKRAEQSGSWPAFTMMSLGEDHTDGLNPGDYSPAACVANNDWALGQLVEAVSHSRFWRETAIFVIEDDAQFGPDHVDCHRTEGLVLSPYSRQHVVDSTRYTTVSMLRTMEMILGLPPMTEYDADATPLYRAFTRTPRFWTYDARRPTIDLEARNPRDGSLAELSSRMDFSEPDRADFQTLNRVLWWSLKPGTRMPAPVHAAWMTASGAPMVYVNDDDDGDGD